VDVVAAVFLWHSGEALAVIQKQPGAPRVDGIDARSDSRSQFEHRSSAKQSLRVSLQSGLAAPLKSDWRFLISCVPRKAVRAPFGGSAETGAGGVRRLLVPILLNGGFGYEDYLRFCSPLAVDHRL
jgi:hypothetical protein